jgi:hypothetical protein
MFQFACPRCQQLMQIPDDRAGVLVICPACKQTVQAPPHLGGATAAGPPPLPVSASPRPDLAADDHRRGGVPVVSPGIPWDQVARRLPLVRAIVWAACWALVLLIFFAHLIRFGGAQNPLERAAVAGDSCAWMIALFVLAWAFDKGADLFVGIMAQRRAGQAPALLDRPAPPEKADRNP